MVEAAGRMEQRDLTVAPALSIFDEILVNAADNKQRDASMTAIKVDIDREKNRISVWNNGRGIPVASTTSATCRSSSSVMHAPRGAPAFAPPADEQPTSKRRHQKKVTGGRNGYGAKLANIFSTEFTVETADSNERARSTSRRSRTT